MSDVVLSAFRSRSSKDCCFSAMPATIVINCESWDGSSETGAAVVVALAVELVADIGAV